MSGGDDWAPGDLALCISDFDHARAAGWPCPNVGSINVVCWVEIADDWACGDRTPDICLTLEGYEAGLWAGRFRKLKPLTDEERREALTDLDVPAPVVPA